MKVNVKLSNDFAKYKPAGEDEVVILCFEKPVPVKTILKNLLIPENLSKLILINGTVKNEEQLLQDGDTICIFPTMSGG